MTHKKPSKKEQELEQKLAELTADLQRVQADFVNYRRRVEGERQQLQESATAATVLKLLPVMDMIELATGQVPVELADNAWVRGVASLAKNLVQSLSSLDIKRIDASPGTPFDPHVHEAITMEDGEGEHEVVTEELRAGYKQGEQVIRPSLVKVGKVKESYKK